MPRVVFLASDSDKIQAQCDCKPLKITSLGRDINSPKEREKLVSVSLSVS